MRHDGRKNLAPFKPGHDGRRNTKGRPPKLPGLDQLLAEVLGEEHADQTAAKFILMALRTKALKGDVRAAEVLLERGYGKVRQDVDVTTKGEKIQRLITQVEIIRPEKIHLQRLQKDFANVWPV